MGVVKPVFVHDPIGFVTRGGSACIEDEGFLHSKEKGSTKDLLVFSCGFPIPRFSGSVGSKPSWVLSVSYTEEIPFLVSHASLPCIYISLSISISSHMHFRIRSNIKYYVNHVYIVHF